jgi:DNA-binding FrmR family transcriptional regulator
LEATVATQARGYTATKQQLLDRLARIEGQVRGVAKMVEEDRYCIDVVTQINAVRAALDKVGLGLLDGHVRHCLIGGHGGPTDPDEQAQELMGAVVGWSRARNIAPARRGILEPVVPHERGRRRSDQDEEGRKPARVT